MTSHDTLQRRDRYQPSSTGKRISLKPRDLRWFKALADHGPLPSHYLHSFTAAAHGNAKSSRVRLTDLASETDTPDGGAYLVRPAKQRAMENARNRSLIYDLGEPAWRALALKRQEVLRPTGPFAHQLMVACATASIELACMAAKSIRYISGSHILARSGTSLGVDIAIPSPTKGRMEKHRLIPDQLFALEYIADGKSRYMSFVVECDRGTEPVTSTRLSRKSYLRNYFQYRAFIGEGSYRDHYGLKSPMFVLNVMNHATHKTAYMDLIADHAPQGNAFMLFRTIDNFGASFSPPPVMSELLSEPWDCVGHEPFQLNGQ